VRVADSGGFLDCSSQFTNLIPFSLDANLEKKNEGQDELEGGFQPEGDFASPTFLGYLWSVCIKSSKLAEKLVYREIVQIHCDGSVKQYNYTDTSFSARAGHCHLDYLDSVPPIVSPLALPRAGGLNHLIVDHW